MISIPVADLEKGKTIVLPVNGFSLKVNERYENAALVDPKQLPTSDFPHLQLGPMAVAVAVPKTYKQDEHNAPVISATLLQNGQSVSSWILAGGFPQPTHFKIGDKNYDAMLRPKRYYRPFSLALEEFHHDRYVGTEIAKNFSSKVRIADREHNENRESLIFMNHPLRYAGLTFYQASYGNNDQTSVLQVMKNPSWLIPYISCGLISLGMLVQFGMHLISFIRRRVIA